MLASIASVVLLPGISALPAMPLTVPEHQPIACLGSPSGWSRPYGNVAISASGRVVQEPVRSWRLPLLGSRVPDGQRRPLPVLERAGGIPLDASYCEGTGDGNGNLWHSHDHCVGAYEAVGYRFGDYLVGSVYSTADSSSVSPPAPSPPLDVGGDKWYSPVRGQQLGSWTPGADWTLSFDLFPRGTTAPWASILHVGSENGLRLPGIWFWPNTYRLSRMLVCLGCWFVSDALGCSDSIRVHEHLRGL